VIDVCTGCAQKHNGRLGFAIHLAHEGRLALLHGTVDQPGHELFEEYHVFYNTDTYRKSIALNIIDFEGKIKEAEELVCELSRSLAAQKEMLAVSNVRRAEME